MSGVGGGRLGLGWGAYVFLELRLGVGDVYDFRVTTGSLKFSAALLLLFFSFPFPPESNSPCTAEIDSGTEECALSKKSNPLTVEEEESRQMPFGFQNFTTCPLLSTVRHAGLL